MTELPKDDATDLRLVERLRRVASGSAVVVIAVGLLVLVGWWLDVELLKSLLHRGRVAMNPLTAVTFVLAGASLWLLGPQPSPRWRRQLGVGLGIAVIGIALLVLPRFTVGVDLGADRLLFGDRLGTSVMAPNTVLTFLLIGLALALLETRLGRRFWPSQPLVLTASVLSLFWLTGYLYGVLSLYVITGYMPMALNTALMFVTLCIGILAARPEREPVAILASKTAGGALVRRLLPAAVVIPLALGMLLLRTREEGLYGMEVGLTIFALGTIILFNLMIWWYASVVRRTDIERAMAVAALRENEARVRLIVDTAHDAFIAIDQLGVITDWNNQAEATFGWTRQEAIGRAVADVVIPPQYRDEHNRGLEHFLRTGEGPLLNHRIEISAVHRDGHEFPVELTITPIRLAGEWIFSAFIHDITERKQVEGEVQEKNRLLEEATRAKSEFLANMSHEIRTPMNGVIGMTDLLLSTDLSRQQREYAELVEQSAHSLLHLLNDILDFSKIEAGKLELETIPFSVRDALGDTLKTLSLRAAEKGLELAYRILPDVPDALLGDPGRFRQIVVNLTGNAVKFTETGEVVVTAEVESVSRGAATLHVAVRDTGIGIPVEKQQIIFEAFRQADASMSRQFGGTGLGLAISLELVSLMGGRMWLESEPGRGSTFHFTATFGMQEDAPRRPPAPGLLRGLRVLIVDDNATNRRILEEMLESWKMIPTAVEGGAAALTALEQATATGHPFELVLFDGMMPGMDGFSLAERIRTLPDYADLPLMMLSSAGRADGVRAAKLGIARTLTKPVKQSDLLEAIQAVVTTEDAAAAPLPAVGDERPPELQPLRILLAEDGVVNQKVAMSLLQERGHTVVLAENGKEAVAAWEREPFSLVLMDVQMPEMDGLQATETIREREKSTGGHIPIVAMTANAMKGDRERCLEAGMDDYIAKPVRADELYEVVERAARGDPTELGLTVNSITEADTMAEQALDWEEALSRIGGSEAMLQDLAAVFVQECPGMMQQIREAIDRGGADELRRTAHTLKGSAALFVATPTVEAALRLERIGETGQLAEAEEAWHRLEAEIARLVTELERAPGSA